MRLHGGDGLGGGGAGALQSVHILGSDGSALVQRFQQGRSAFRGVG